MDFLRRNNNSFRNDYKNFLFIMFFQRRPKSAINICQQHRIDVDQPAEHRKELQNECRSLPCLKRNQDCEEPRRFKENSPTHHSTKCKNVFTTYKSTSSTTKPNPQTSMAFLSAWLKISYRTIDCHKLLIWYLLFMKTSQATLVYTILEIIA
uniref:Uncharacterized protein n=1 Tax=Glossina pallidipes TaxID=7398 RepID=A0A1A9Z809_GLOPL